MLRLILAASLVAWLAGCSADDGPRADPTYQECFDDQTLVEKKVVAEAIVLCCLDHPIDGAKPACGATSPDCINYLTDNLKQTSAGVDEVALACMMYEEKKDMQEMK
jgi:hypothetical protein